MRWWCNAFGVGSQINIEKCRLLKEFMIANPPDFSISDGCCKGAKKDVAHDYMREIKATINMVGIRKAKGGARATAARSLKKLKKVLRYSSPILLQASFGTAVKARMGGGES